MEVLICNQTGEISKVYKCENQLRNSYTLVAKLHMQVVVGYSFLLEVDTLKTLWCVTLCSEKRMHRFVEVEMMLPKVLSNTTGKNLSAL